MFRCVLYVDLVGTDTETANNDEVLCFSQDSSGQLCLRAYANYVYIAVWAC